MIDRAKIRKFSWDDVDFNRPAWQRWAGLFEDLFLIQPESYTALLVRLFGDIERYPTRIKGADEDEHE